MIIQFFKFLLFNQILKKERSNLISNITIQTKKKNCLDFNFLMDHQNEQELVKRESSFLSSFGLVKAYQLNGTSKLFNGNTNFKIEEYRQNNLCDDLNSLPINDKTIAQTKSQIIYGLPFGLLYSRRDILKHPRGRSLLHHPTENVKKEEYIGSRYEQFCNKKITSLSRLDTKLINSLPQVVFRPEKKILGNILNVNKDKCSLTNNKPKNLKENCNSSIQMTVPTV